MDENEKLGENQEISENADGIETEKTRKRGLRNVKISAAMSFVLLMGIVSLFSDMTHEGATSVLGAYLNLLGASAATIGFISGLGVFIGYSLRLLTGFLTDKTKKYWTITIVGYVVDVMAIPLLAAVTENGWIAACGLILLEKIGKALKKPAKNTMLSFAAREAGAGKSFAIQEFLDQIGAVAGPLIMFAALYLKRNGSLFDGYRLGFLLLAVPAMTTLCLLFFSKKKFPHPEQFEKEESVAVKKKFDLSFVFYLVAISLFAMGFIDFPLITMHIANNNLASTDVLPLFYSAAMAVDAFSALFFGWLFDKYGIKVLMISTLLSSSFALLVFGFDSLLSVCFGVFLWGVGMGAQESILKAVVAKLVPKSIRSTGYGVFETVFGVFWFLGSWATGALYDFSRVGMIIFSIAAQLVSIVFFALTYRMNKKDEITADENSAHKGEI